MDEHVSKRVIHRYDTTTRRVLCGVAEQTGSTKHSAGVTCPTCRELLRRPAPAAPRFEDALDAHGA